MIEEKSERRWRFVFWLLIPFIWVTGCILGLTGLTFFTESCFEKIASPVAIVSEHYYLSMDGYIEPDGTSSSPGNLLQFYSLFGSVDLNYDRCEFSGQEKDFWNKHLFDGCQAYYGVLITDSNDVPIKGTDAMIVENTPCLGENVYSLKCYGTMIGMVDPKTTLTEEEIGSIEKVLSIDKDAMVISERYKVDGLNCIPLSLKVIGSKGQEMESLDLSRNENLLPEADITEETIYYHNPFVHFHKSTEYKTAEEQKMNDWIGHLQTVAATGGADPIGEREIFSPDYKLGETGEKFGPIKTSSSVFYGKNCKFYLYASRSMSVPLVRLALIFLGGWSLVCLSFYGILRFIWIRAVLRRKKRISQS